MVTHAPQSRKALGRFFPYRYRAVTVQSGVRGHPQSASAAESRHLRQNVANAL